ncbi:hypothetical protein LQ938_06785 [Microbacterium sp. cx-55]|uniref:hypothetical protein n=1 Tax=unclassified Microbacterium TaxID=2609290 RepID=UPI001CBB054A|nr:MULTISPECIES: hypothetical protein [unclassified Microbacterium]MBZ4486549.1 hypothetical protein [Microbacterium sp. cx-55]MCC4907517.1 hypothetical protein [Microbacterium sp. cx-59]UGB36483.1 hypothetical protein LQ938_06785 [Microbacterium sp. cx-55]
MTEPTVRFERDHAFASDVDLEEMIADLLHGANRRQLWMLFLGEDDVLLDPIVPCDDYPDDPALTARTDDLGTVTFPTILAHRVASLRELIGFASVVLVWERRGSDLLTPTDIAWSRAMAESAADVGVDLRVQFVLHDRGVRQITPVDDGAAAA